MRQRTNFPTDWVSVLSIAFGAAVIIPSVIALVLIVVTIGKTLL
jgi:hypothetical protein